jgi:hypothetical protein
VQSTQTALNILSILEKSPGQGRRFKGGGAAFVREICVLTVEFLSVTPGLHYGSRGGRVLLRFCLGFKELGCNSSPGGAFETLYNGQLLKLRFSFEHWRVFLQLSPSAGKCLKTRILATFSTKPKIK